MIILQALTNQFLSDVNPRSPVLQYLFVNLLSNKNICMCSLSKKCLICIPAERKPFWQLSDFAVSCYGNLFVYEKQSNLFPRTFLFTFNFSEEKSW